MKSSKTLLIAMIVAASTQVQAEMTLSLDLINDFGDREVSLSSSYSNQFAKDYVSDSTGFRVRWGLGSIEDNRIELYLSSYDVDEDGEFNDSAEVEAGINYIVTFKNMPVIPFFKVGLGVGSADTDRTFINSSGDRTENIHNFHFNLGGGIDYRITDDFAVTGAIEYVYRNWQDIESISTTVSTSDTLLRIGFGVNLTF